jgi:uncharacterized protein (TIGR02328 family)
MRLWHYKLIPVLPKQMLVSQWREVVAIKRQWEKGTLKHRLVSYVMDYDGELFINYCYAVIREMEKRNIKWNYKYMQEIGQFCENKNKKIPDYIYYTEHNDRYLKQCLYNLQEKFDRGIITQEEWSKIVDKFGGYL